VLRPRPRCSADHTRRVPQSGLKEDPSAAPLRAPACLLRSSACPLARGLLRQAAPALTRLAAGLDGRAGRGARRGLDGGAPRRRHRRADSGTMKTPQVPGPLCGPLCGLVRDPVRALRGTLCGTLCCPCAGLVWDPVWRLCERTMKTSPRIQKGPMAGGRSSPMKPDRHDCCPCPPTCPHPHPTSSHSLTRTRTRTHTRIRITLCRRQRGQS
jgi:hypothetical protein